MTTLTISTLMLSMTWIILFSNNPLKTSFFLLSWSSLMFMLMSMSTSMVWIPLIFFMLFTGGILMMFMILSSILPNEKTMKIKYSKMMIFIMITYLMLNLYNKSQLMMMASQMKSFISSSLNLMMMMSTILMYFFSTINLNSSTNLPMRSIQCYNMYMYMYNLVNYKKKM